MNKKILFFTIFLSFFLTHTLMQGQEAQNVLEKDSKVQENQAALEKYKRSSLYTVLASHPSQKYSNEIDIVFLSMPFPDKYENHNLKQRKFVCDKNEKRLSFNSLESFVDTADIAKKMVAKWFNRNPTDGTFNIDLIAERGNYNASSFDVKEALMNKRGLSILADAGEELIPNTFLIVNDIVYVDKEKNAAIFTAILSSIAAVAATTAAISSVASSSSSNTTSEIASLTAASALLGAAISNTIAGFTVKVKSHLYQLDWNDSVAAVFYNDYWCDSSYSQQEIEQRKSLFDSVSGLFNLKYVGSYKVKSGKTVLKGLYTNEDVIRKVCARALDKNIASLQKKYEVFKVKTPVYGVENNLVLSKIGLKEGITPSSKFEVLERKEDAEGNSSFRTVATLKAVKDKIWDNRFMAAEEEATGATLNATTFKKISGGAISNGMLIRQIK